MGHWVSRKCNGTDTFQGGAARKQKSWREADADGLREARRERRKLMAHELNAAGGEACFGTGAYDVRKRPSHSFIPTSVTEPPFLHLLLLEMGMRGGKLFLVYERSL